jgi:hypothetical protein
MLELLKVGIFITLALMAGATVGRQGVLRGDVSAKIGAFDLAICGRRVLGDFIQFRPNKVFYRLAVLPTG